MTKPRRTTRTLTTLLAAAGLTLTACGGGDPILPGGEQDQMAGSTDRTSNDLSDDTPAASAEESTDTTGEPADDMSGDMSGGVDAEWSYQDGEGSYQVGDNVDLPEGFPSDVPQPSSDWNRAAVAVSGDDFIISYTRDGATDDDCTSYLGAFNGWNEEMRATMDGTYTAIFSNENWTAVIGCDAATGMSVQVSPYSG